MKSLAAGLALFAALAARGQELDVRPGPGDEPILLERRHGEDRLMDLCLLAATEDAWVHYVADGAPWWLDVGSEEGPDQVRIAIPWERLGRPREVAVYHIHPVADDLVRAAKRYRPMAHGDDEEYRRFILEGTPGLFSRPPGRADHEGAVELRRQAAARGLALHTRVVVAAGVYRYEGDPDLDLGRAWDLLDFEAYVRPGGHERMVAAFAALGLALDYDPRRDLMYSRLLRERLRAALEAHSPAWNPP